MATIIEEFDATRVTNVGTKFSEDATSIAFGCLGSIEGETELLELVKKCGGVETKKKTTPQKMSLTLNGHVKVPVLRDIFGLSNEGLKAGVYSYGADSLSKPFVLTADVLDEFEAQTKLIAFSNCVAATGLKITVENGADEVAEVELEFTAMIDDNRKCYYEAIISELDEADKDAFVKQWHTNFTPDMVIATP
ncbi:phage tail protein [Listeria monocytogenes]|nr:phage tail protein [Listeria monocytogenes]EEO9465797.1 phage tail protein [Listeria monocytogenes]EHC7869155.1 phage tail protein [Listeria monocytogenes]EJT5473134.1 phage tail protein [Listeria monocytogenes]EJT5519052.1 phage tail protein [Listeria monocytogenes]